MVIVIKRGEVVVIKNHKINKLFAVIICVVLVVVADCLYIFRTQKVTDIISIDNVNLSYVSIMIFNGLAGEDFNEVFISTDESDVNSVVELLSSSSAHLVKWKPLTGLLPTEGDVYVFVIKDTVNYNVFLDYASGYLYYNNCKYKISTKDDKPFLDGIKLICSAKE